MNQNEGAYWVNVWGSVPNTDDDCWTGQDFATLEEAMAAYTTGAGLTTHVTREAQVPHNWLELDGPDVHLERQVVPGATRPAARDDEWQHEAAMLAGMEGGCNAYNEVMGWD